MTSRMVYPKDEIVYSRSDCETMDEASILNGIKVEILREKRAQLVKFLNPDRHYDFLRSQCVLSGDDCEEINHKVTRRQKASLMLDKLLDHGGNAYDRLCESLLRERTQMFLLKSLNMEYENKMNNCKALFQASVNRSTTIKLAVDTDTLPRPPPPTLASTKQWSISDDSTA
ncbi:B-cell lymphoma/leukemia 10-like [Haliotis cracherodii]|uniref:B-cell lymphoma/leukemia 10-like n=1 Tax=Haliotis cracherodii TaxID=6455 RepID=UPI0039ECD670